MAAAIILGFFLVLSRTELSIVFFRLLSFVVFFCFYLMRETLMRFDARLSIVLLLFFLLFSRARNGVVGFLKLRKGNAGDTQVDISIHPLPSTDVDLALVEDP